MSKPDPVDALAAILGAISQFPAGARIEQIEASLPKQPPRRTLQRRLAELVSQKRVQTRGVGRATRYVRGFADSQISLKDRPIFIEVTETQLMSLHEGNIARYRLRPSEFQAWQVEWR